MTKYETFLKKQASVRSTINAIRRAIGQHSDGTRDSQNDKARFSFSFNGLANAPFAPAKIWLDMLHGYYGSSSGYSDTSEETAQYVVSACNALAKEIALKAMDLAQQDLANAQADAQDEALVVLGNVSKEGRREEAIQEIW